MPSHASLTGADLHETKGADTAAANTVHVADGTGGTLWQKVTEANVDATSIFDTNLQTMTILLESVNGLFSKWVPIAWDCELVNVYAAIDTAPSATLTIDFYNGASSLIDSISFTALATPGDVDNFTGVSNITFTQGSVLRIRNSTAIASSGNVVVTLTFRRTA